MGLRTHWFDNLDDIQPWQRQWDALAMRQAIPLPMMALSWVLAWLHNLATEQTNIRFGIVIDGDRLVAAIPLVKQRIWGRNSLTSPYDIHSSCSGMIVEHAYAESASDALLSSIAGQRHLRCGELVQRGVATDSPGLSSAVGWRRIANHRNVGSFLPVPDDYTNWLAGLSKNFRANLRKTERRWKEAGLENRSFVWCRGMDAAPSLLRAFLDLECAGWKGRAETAIAQDPALVGFYGELVERFERLGWLEWHFLYFKGTLIAAHLGIRMGRSLTLLKIAYDESYAQLSPGNTLFRSLVEKSVLDGDLDEINCLTDMQWHRNWRMAQRSYSDVRYFPKGVGPYLLGVVPRKLLTKTRLAKRAMTRKKPETKNRRTKQ